MTCFALEFTPVKVLSVSLSNNFPMLGCAIHRKQQISHSPVVIKEKCDHSEVYTNMPQMFRKKVHISI
jgi:hypothetical protein